MDSSGSDDQHYLRSSQSPSRRVLGPSSAANEPEASADGNHVFRAPNPVGKKRNSLSDIDHQVTPSRDLRRVSYLKRLTAVISHMGIGFEHAYADLLVAKVHMCGTPYRTKSGAFKRAKYVSYNSNNSYIALVKRKACCKCKTLGSKVIFIYRLLTLTLLLG